MPNPPPNPWMQKIRSDEMWSLLPYPYLRPQTRAGAPGNLQRPLPSHFLVIKILTEQKRTGVRGKSGEGRAPNGRYLADTVRYIGQ